jgi:hypothetical protein
MAHGALFSRKPVCVWLLVHSWDVSHISALAALSGTMLSCLACEGRQVLLCAPTNVAGVIAVPALPTCLAVKERAALPLLGCSG